MKMKNIKVEEKTTKAIEWFIKAMIEIRDEGNHLNETESEILFKCMDEMKKRKGTDWMITDLEK